LSTKPKKCVNAVADGEGGGCGIYTLHRRTREEKKGFPKEVDGLIDRWINEYVFSGRDREDQCGFPQG
jgi:hypothetical protein